MYVVEGKPSETMVFYLYSHHPLMWLKIVFLALFCMASQLYSDGKYNENTHTELRRETQNQILLLQINRYRYQNKKRLKTNPKNIIMKYK